MKQTFKIVIKQILKIVKVCLLRKQFTENQNVFQCE